MWWPIARLLLVSTAASVAESQPLQCRSNTSIAPIPVPKHSVFLSERRNAVSQANTGSKVKITAMFAAGITCCAQVWTPKANAVARTPATSKAKWEPGAVAGLLPGLQAELENPSLPVP